MGTDNPVPICVYCFFVHGFFPQMTRIKLIPTDQTINISIRLIRSIRGSPEKNQTANFTNFLNK